MRGAHHLCLQPFLGKAAGHVDSDFSSLLVSQGPELLSCVILFWCQTGHIVFVSKLIDMGCTRI